MNIINNYVKYKELMSNIDIKKGDILYVASDITKLAITCKKNKDIFDPNLFIDSIINKIGPKGTLLFPTYNWDFCKGITFDSKNTGSMTGGLSNIALKRKDFRRTKNPIYSFAVIGKDQDYLCGLEHSSCFGRDSPFHYLRKNGGKNLFIDIDYKNGFTIDHYAEETIGVSYRYFKNFSGNYIDEKNNKKFVTYKMYVRDLSKKVVTKINPRLDKILKSKNAYKIYNINKINFGLINLQIACKIMEEDIKSNGGLIYPGKISE